MSSPVWCGPSSGEVRIGSTSCRRLSVHRRVHLGLARTFQRASLFADLSVQDHLTLAAEAKHIWRRRAAARTAGGAASLDVESDADVGALEPQPRRLVGGLRSGGTRAVELAMALVVPPRVLLLDEPLSGLDPVERDAFASTLRDIRARLGITVVLVEHDVESVVRLADRLVVLDFGVKLADGPTSEILTNTKVREAYFGIGGDGLMATDLAPTKAFTAASLRLENVSHSYGALPALRNVTLDVPAGTVCAVLGTNGAGKSTLAATIAGVVPTSPGSVCSTARTSAGWPATPGPGVGCRTPEGGALFPGLTVAENILVGDRGASRQERKETLEKAAALFPFMRKRWNERAGMLSGGEQQMVSLSRVLVHPSAVVAIDELSHGLAPAIVEQLFRCWPASGGR